MTIAVDLGGGGGALSNKKKNKQNRPTQMCKARGADLPFFNAFADATPTHKVQNP